MGLHATDGAASRSGRGQPRRAHRREPHRRDAARVHHYGRCRVHRGRGEENLVQGDCPRRLRPDRRWAPRAVRRRVAQIQRQRRRESRESGREGVMAETALRNFTINFGPQHPSAHGVLRLVLELDGEVVERVDPHIGLLHRGTEKLMEARTYLQNIPYFDRLDYVAPMNQEHAFCLAIEKLLGLEVPRRGQLLRVLFCEIGRILSHLLCITTQAMDVGALTPPLWGFEEREKLMVFYERASGSRMHANYFRPGGVHGDIPKQLIEDIGAWCDPFLKVREDLQTLFIDNRIFKQRNVDIGVVSLEECWRRGFSGVMVRGSGAPWDLRKAQPYECCEEMEFDIPVGRHGRQLRPASHSHGRDAPIGPDYEAMRRENHELLAFLEAPQRRRQGTD